MPTLACPHCGVMQIFSIQGRTEDPARGGTFHGVGFCLDCGKEVYFQVNRENEERWHYPTRVEKADEELPDKVKDAFNEALVCYGAKAPNGALLMCRRALQETMNDLKAKRGDLPVQLNDLVEKQTITPRLKQWADQARIGGRIAAHGNGGDEWGDPSKIWGTIEDAGVVIEYLKAFFEHIYLLDARLKKEMEAREITEAPPPEEQSETDNNEQSPSEAPGL